MGKNGEETKTSLFYILVKSYDHMYSNKHIKTVSKFIEDLTENKNTHIAPMAGEKLNTCAL